MQQAPGMGYPGQPGQPMAGYPRAPSPNPQMAGYGAAPSGPMPGYPKVPSPNPSMANPSMPAYGGGMPIVPPVNVRNTEQTFLTLSDSYIYSVMSVLLK